MIETDFFYNGRYSSEFGVYLVNVEGSGMQETPFLSNREIISETIRGNNIPYVYGFQYSPLDFRVTLSCLENEWTFEKRREVARWLDIEKFGEFYTLDNPSKRLFLTYIDGIDLSHNGIMQGWINITMRNISSYSYSPVYETDYSIEGSKLIEVANKGDNPILPELWIRKKGNGDIRIKNFTNGGKEFHFKNLLNNETVYVDNKLKHIETDVPDMYRFDDFNNEYLELLTGINHLEISGDCDLLLKYQFEFKG